MWFSDNRVGNGVKRSPPPEANRRSRLLFRPQDKSQTLGILAFETAKTMSRLLSLHKSLLDDEVSKLRKDTVRFEGISYLISKDDEFLLKLACKEKIEEIDRAADTVARLGKNCTDPDLYQFDRVYSDLKSGYIDISYYFEARSIDKTIDKLEKFTSATAELYGGLESLAEMELSEQKLKSWKNSVPNPNPKNPNQRNPKANFDLFEQKIAWQRQRVTKLKQISLWGQTYNKMVRLMARAICIVYARMCVVFSPYISILPRFAADSKRGLESGAAESNWVAKQAGPSTVGGSGLALRYANVVLRLDKYLIANEAIDKNGREELYQMLPASLKRLVKRKLKEVMEEEVVEVGTLKELMEDKKKERGSSCGGCGEVAGVDRWKDGSRKILRWLTPMAHSTVRWEMERNVEKQTFDSKPKVVLMQTLFFADRVKTEGAIADVLVALSCKCKVEVRRVL